MGENPEWRGDDKKIWTFFIAMGIKETAARNF
jgi:hypothetical protein